MDKMHRQEDLEGKVSHKIEVLLKEKIIPTLENLTAENAPKIQKKINKMSEKLSNIEIDIPDIEEKVKNILSQISDTMTITLDDNTEEDIEKYKDAAINKVNKSWDNISDYVAQKKSDVETGINKQSGNIKKNKEEEVNERSRMKILELLEQGKITPDDAEKLIRALNGSKE